MNEKIGRVYVENNKITLLIKRECPYDELILTKEEAMELAGELYEMAESIPERPITTLPFIGTGECLGKEGEQQPFPEELLREMKENWLVDFSNPKEKYNPEKDSQYIYQKELLKQIVIDIVNDDREIVKKFIKKANRHPKAKDLINMD